MDHKTIKTPIEDVFSTRFGRYSKYIIQERALPDVRDGLKPVQRRILYAMYKDNNVYDKQFRKSAKTVGNVIGNYHPHGDTSVYEAMVRMSQSWKVHEELVVMHGNNGSIDGDNPAAMRYTEAKLSKYSSYLLHDIEKDTVKMAPNFDDTMLEPQVLPTMVPNLLINGTQGIASGYATEIPPHNPEEVLKASIYLNKNKDATLSKLMKYVKGPDFPTGGIIEGADNIKTAYETGRGKIRLSCKYEIVKNDIIITEIPYDVNKSTLLQKIELVKLEKKVEGISDVVDQSDRNGLEIKIGVSKSADPQVVMNYLLKNTDLQKNYNFNMIAINNKKPQLLGIKGILLAFLDHREEVTISKSKFLLFKAQSRLEIVEGLIKAIDDLDNLVKLIRKSKDKKDAKTTLEKYYDLSERQSEAIVIMPLYKLTATDIDELRVEHESLLEQIENLERILNNPDVLTEEIEKDLKVVLKNFKEDRKSEIKEEIVEIHVDKADLIKEETNILVVTENNYAKRNNLRSYLTAKTSPQNLAGDKTSFVMKIKNKDQLLMCFDDGSYSLVPAYEIEENKWKDPGKNLSVVIKNVDSRKIVNIIPYQAGMKVLSITAKGYLSCVESEEFLTKKVKNVIKYQKIKNDDKVVSVKLVDDKSKLIMLTNDDKYQLFDMDMFEVNQIKRVGTKVKSINKKQSIKSLNEIEQNLLMMSNDGYYFYIKYEELIEHTYRFEKLFENQKDQKILDKIITDVNGDILVVTDEDYETFSLKNLKYSALGDKVKSNKSLNNINIICYNIDIK